MMIGKRLWEERGVVHVLCSKRYFIRYSTCVKTAPFYPIPVCVHSKKFPLQRHQKKKKSLNWYSKWQEGKSRGVRVLCMLLGGIWINASAYLSRGEPCLVTGGGNGPPLFWGPQVHLGSDVGRLGRELLPALAVTEGCGDREDWRIPLRASEEKW